MSKNLSAEQLKFKKWTLKEKIHYIRINLEKRNFDVILHNSSIEWVSRDNAEAGNIQLKFLQEFGELDFDKKIAHYFNLVTDKPGDKESATQRERRVRDDVTYYQRAETLTAKAPTKKSTAKKSTTKKTTKK